jgi:4-amino-4-deoxy-L-arabinose transferase-like glycosyltransferase
MLWYDRIGSVGMPFRIQEYYARLRKAEPAAQRNAALWLFLFALSIRLLVLSLVHTDGLYGQDAFAYFDCARELLAGPNPCSDFRWPLGYPALAAMVMAVTGTAARGAQFVSVMTGAAIAPLAYWMVVMVMPPSFELVRRMDAAIAAGLLTAVCGQLVLSSIVIMSDAPGLFWASLSACLLLRWERHSGRVPLVLPSAAAALAVAIATRWVYGALVIPFSLFVLLAAGRKIRHEGWRATAVSVGISVFLLSSLVAILLYYNAHSSAPVENHSWVVDWSMSNSWHLAFDNPDGHFQYHVPPLIFYAGPLIHPLYLCPVLVGCVLVGAWRLRHSAAGLLLVGWVAILYGYLVGIPYENGRFGLAFFTPVAAFAGVGLWTLPPRFRISYRAPWLLLIGSMIVTGGFACRSLMAFDSGARRQQAEIQYLQSQVPAGSTVVTFGLSISVAHYTQFAVVDLFEQSPQSLRPNVCGNSSVYLYVDRPNIESQWAGRTPALNVHWLEHEVGLRQIGTNNGWWLYRVAACSP